jgi:hypothetical protein
MVPINRDKSKGSHLHKRWLDSFFDWISLQFQHQMVPGILVDVQQLLDGAVYVYGDGTPVARADAVPVLVRMAYARSGWFLPRSLPGSQAD